jgi:hypothetical protein
MRIMLAGFRIARQIVTTEPFRSLVIEQIRPGPEITSDEQAADYVRQIGSTVYHPCGTCRMGEDDGAVVDSQLRVRGIDGLRVVDAVRHAGDALAEHSSGDDHGCREELRYHRQDAGELTAAKTGGDQFVRAAGTLISCGRISAATITSRHSAPNACSMVTKPPARRARPPGRRRRPPR